MSIAEISIEWEEEFRGGPYYHRLTAKIREAGRAARPFLDGVWVWSGAPAQLRVQEKEYVAFSHRMPPSEKYGDVTFPTQVPLLLSRVDRPLAAYPTGTPPPDAIEHLRRWARSNRPDMIRYIDAVVDVLAVQGEALRLLVRCAFDAGRWCERGGPGAELPLLGLNPYKE